MSLLQMVVGKPLATSEERGEHIGPIAGIPVFGLDALSSAAYGPEAALTLLIPLGLAGVQHIVPISFAIIALVTLSTSPTCRRSMHTQTAAAAIPSRRKILGSTGATRGGGPDD